MNYEIYFVDTETTGLDAVRHDVIELSILRLTTNEQRTWMLKPTNLENIDLGALRVNGHKIEDLRWETKYGRETYRDPNQVIVEVENWLMEDGIPTTQRSLLGQNISFDKGFLEQLWIKCNSKDSFPFGRRYMDTMIIAMMIDYVEGNTSEGYSLNNLIKKYGIKNDKAHSAAGDVRATKELFEKQVEELRKKMGIK